MYFVFTNFRVPVLCKEVGVIQHFFIGYVLLAYTVVLAIFWEGIAPVRWDIVVGASLVLMVVDYVVHHENHYILKPSIPYMSVVWVAGLLTLTASGMVTEGKQVAQIFVAQAVWDNSWHAFYNHREANERRAHMDHWVFRLAPPIAALLVAFQPKWSH